MTPPGVRWRTGAWAVLLGGAAAMSSCGFENETTGLGVVRSYIQRVQRGQCDKAFQLLSNTMQERAKAEVQRRRGKVPGITRAEDVYCVSWYGNPFATMVPSSVRRGGSAQGTTLIQADQKDAGGGLTAWNVEVIQDGKVFRILGVGPSQ